MASLGPDILIRTGTLDAHYECYLANLVPVPDEHDFEGLVIRGDRQTTQHLLIFVAKIASVALI
jgi:hypothetical protein